MGQKAIEVLCRLLPDTKNLQLENWLINEAQATITLIIASVQTVTQCPICASQTHRIHSRYKRTLADLPWADYRITLQMSVRKFFCININCKRRIFTERLANVTAPWARRTLRLAQRFTATGLALGGAAGVRLSRRDGFTVSRNTLLRLVRRMPLTSVDSPQTLGVDDFAFRKSQTYGTILVDLEQSQPIALLKDRSAETLAQWLKGHPGIKVVSRDRAKAYASGISQGAPEAIQVADPFHLLQNLGETLERVFHGHSKDLKEVDEAYSQIEVIQTDGTVVAPVPPPPTPTKQERLAEQRRTRRLAIYQQVWELHRQGWSGQAIARRLGIGHGTVFRYLSSPTFVERQGRSDRGRSLLNPYKDYLLKRWNEGYIDTKGLFEEIQRRGYSGSYDTVARYTRRLRSSQGLKLRQRLVNKPLPIVAEPQKKSLTPSRATWLVLRRQELWKRGDEQLIALLTAQHPQLAEAIELGQGFAQLVRTRQPEQLDLWLIQAENSILSPFRNFAKSLREDYDAVKAGVTLSVSNGPVEGHINRLKMLKRQMYGRAGIDLLERRFLLAI